MIAVVQGINACRSAISPAPQGSLRCAAFPQPLNRTARALARSPRVYPGNPNIALASFIPMPCLEERAARTSMRRAPPRAFSRRRTRMEVGTPVGIARLRSFAPCGLTGCIWTVRAGSTYVPVVDARNDSNIAFFSKSGVDLVAFRGAPH